MTPRQHFPHKLQAGIRLWLAVLLLVISAGASAESFNQQVDALFADLDSTDSAGCAVSVIQNGEIIYSRGYGMANLDHQVPIRAETVFDIGSTSKQFTAAAIALLALDGRLSLDDDIRKFLPEIPQYEHVITIRHLLHHTSGLRDFAALTRLSGVDDHDVITYADLVQLTSRQTALNFRPGEDFLYSNTGYVMLAVIVQRASGMGFGEFLDQHVFGPLEMKQSLVYEDSTRIIPHRAMGYSPTAGGSLAIDHMWNFAIGGDGQVYSTVGDLAQWDANFYNPSVGGQDFIDMMQTQGQLNNGETIEYALGLFIGEHRGLKTVRHGGAWGGFRAQFIRVPDYRFSTVVLCNLGNSDPSARAKAILDIYLEEHLAPLDDPESQAEFTPSAKDLEAIRGKFLLDLGVMVNITAEEGKPVLTFSETTPFEMTPRGADRFYIGGLDAMLVFEDKADGAWSGFRVELDSNTMQAVRVEPFETDSAQLQEFSGNYFSEDLGVDWRMELEEQQLLMRVGVNAEFPLLFTGEDRFASGGFTGRFERNSSGQVTAVVVDAGRTKNLKAVRQDN